MKQLHAVTWKEDKWFVAKALEIEVASQGRSEKEALENLHEALELYFEDANIDVKSAESPKLQDIALNLHA